MHIVVCIKYTPSAMNVPIDPATGQLKTAGLQYAVNPFDEYAVEEALRLKERLPGSTVSALTFGQPAAEEAIRAAVALGCDGGAVITDPSFNNSDPTATSYLLSLGIKKLGESKPVGLVLCGKQTNDGENGQVGASLAAFLDWPSIMFVKKIPAVTEQTATFERSMEDGIDSLEANLPAVISVLKEINEPRLPSLKGKMAAKKLQIPKWAAGDLSADMALVGASSPTVQTKATPPPARGGGVKVPGGSAAEKAEFLVQKLKEMKLI